MQVLDEDTEMNDERNSICLCVIATHVNTSTICVYTWTLRGKGKIRNREIDKECDREKEEDTV